MDWKYRNLAAQCSCQYDLIVMANLGTRIVPFSLVCHHLICLFKFRIICSVIRKKSDFRWVDHHHHTILIFYCPIYKRESSIFSFSKNYFFVIKWINYELIVFAWSGKILRIWWKFQINNPIFYFHEKCFHIKFFKINNCNKGLNFFILLSSNLSSHSPLFIRGNIKSGNGLIM